MWVLISKNGVKLSSLALVWVWWLRMKHVMQTNRRDVFSVPCNVPRKYHTFVVQSCFLELVIDFERVQLCLGALWQTIRPRINHVVAKATHCTSVKVKISCLSFRILYYNEAGMITALTRKWWPKNVTCDRKSQKTETRAIGFNHMQGLYIVGFGVIAMSGVILFIENIVYHLKRKTITRG